MAINFPNSPQAGDPHSEAGIDWVYDGEKWVAQSEATFWARTGSTLSPSTAGDNISTTGDLTAGCTTTGTGGSSGEAKVVGYQQGKWIPICSEGTVDSAADKRTWVRIGNLVTVRAHVYTFSERASGANVVITGLPYPVAADTNGGSCMWNKTGLPATAVYLNASSQVVQFYQTSTGTANDWVGLKYNHFVAGSGGHFIVSYLTENTTWTPANGATIS